MASNIPVSLYIHIPWCRKKCPYCDFNSFPIIKQIPEHEYTVALKNELLQGLNLLQGRKLHTIFIGGGTPTIFDIEQLKFLIDNILASAPLSENIEVTIEANPGTVNANILGQLRKSGINRLSIGAQSFQNKKLQILGRIHTQKDIIAAINMAKDSGFSNINLDLMFGLPEQTVAEAVDDLRNAISLNPTHISWYQLTIEENTPFAKQNPHLPDEAEIIAMQDAGKALLQESGFEQYEVSAFAKPGFQCQHNVNYWQFGDYLGIGAGAHSKITDLQNKQVYRFANPNFPNKYLKNVAARLRSESYAAASLENIILRKINEIATTDLPFEFMLNALRLYQKIPFSLFTERTFLPKSVLLPYLEKLKNQEFLEFNETHFWTTSKGKDFVNEMLLIFL
jgi:oxygen-independent coproporphyrinogen-3 oxidase